MSCHRYKLRAIVRRGRPLSLYINSRCCWAIPLPGAGLPRWAAAAAARSPAMRFAAASAAAGVGTARPRPGCREAAVGRLSRCGRAAGVGAFGSGGGGCGMVGCGGRAIDAMGAATGGTGNEVAVAAGGGTGKAVGMATAAGLQDASWLGPSDRHGAIGDGDPEPRGELSNATGVRWENDGSGGENCGGGSGGGSCTWVAAGCGCGVARVDGPDGGSRPVGPGVALLFRRERICWADGCRRLSRLRTRDCEPRGANDEVCAMCCGGNGTAAGGCWDGGAGTGAASGEAQSGIGARLSRWSTSGIWRSIASARRRAAEAPMERQSRLRKAQQRAMMDISIASAAAKAVARARFCNSGDSWAHVIIEPDIASSRGGASRWVAAKPVGSVRDAERQVCVYDAGLGLYMYGCMLRTHTNR